MYGLNLTTTIHTGMIILASDTVVKLLLSFVVDWIGSSFGIDYLPIFYPSYIMAAEE